MTARRNQRDETQAHAASSRGDGREKARCELGESPAGPSTWLQFEGTVWAADGVPLNEVARAVGTPAYVYSARQVARNVEHLRGAFAQIPTRILYAIKANPNGAVLRLLARMGLGAEVVSGGELYRALRAGFAAELVAFSGAGKTDAEIEAAIGAGVGTLILESLAEIPVAETLARRTGRRVPVALRLHPSIDAGTHPYLATGQPETKFGLEEAGLKAALRQLERSETLELVGLHAHIGSQIGSIAPYVHARRVLLDAAEAAREQGHRLRFVDLGGGFAIPYGEEDRAFPLGDLAKAIGEGWPEPLELRIEPGRLLVGDAGLLLVRVLYTKTCGAKEFVIVDAGMSALVRPALYGARHRVLAVEPRRGNPHTVDVVGPICENADVLARNCSLPPTERGDLLAVLDVGAYGFTMASQYNSQPRPAEAIVREGRVHLVRARETYAGLVEGEMEDCAAGPTGGGAEVRVRGRSESAERRSS